MSREITRIVSQIIMQELKDPRMGFITVIKADVSADLRYAKIYVSILGDEKKQRLTMYGLKHARGYIQGSLARQLRIRIMPRIEFVLSSDTDSIGS